MQKGLMATATVTIGSDASKVWKSLTTPEAIKKWMFGADVESEWQIGSPIIWSGEFNGKKYKDKGEILRFEPRLALSFSHFSPLSGEPDIPENYHTVDIRLSEKERTTTVSLDQDNNANEESRAESEKNWKAVLDDLKKQVEASS